jgi:hypothetical protein
MALLGGFVMAGYKAALPPALQHVAYRLLGSVGIPDADHSARHRSGHLAGTNGPTLPLGARGSAARPAIANGAPLVASPASQRILAGGTVVITAWLSRGSHPVSGRTLSLRERPVGKRGWKLVDQAGTTARGRAVLVAPYLTVNAAFQVTAPGGLASRSLTIVVVPPLSLRVHDVHGGRHAILSVRCPLAGRGDLVELQGLLGRSGQPGAWRALRSRKLHGGGRATFILTGRLARQGYLAFRVVLLATATHGWSTSARIAVTDSHAGWRFLGSRPRSRHPY